MRSCATPGTVERTGLDLRRAMTTARKMRRKMTARETIRDATALFEETCARIFRL